MTQERREASFDRKDEHKMNSTHTFSFRNVTNLNKWEEREHELLSVIYANMERIERTGIWQGVKFYVNFNKSQKCYRIYLTVYTKKDFVSCIKLIHRRHLIKINPLICNEVNTIPFIYAYIKHESNYRSPHNIHYNAGFTFNSITFYHETTLHPSSPGIREDMYTYV